MVLKQKHVLFGLFYRPTNSDSYYLSTIEDSIHLAVDTGISYIITTGDFNYNMLKVQTARKHYDFCEEFSLTQMINDPTHFTESSSSLIDILLVSNKHSVILSDVGDPFLSQEMRYPASFRVFKVSKPKRQSF